MRASERRWGNGHVLAAVLLWLMIAPAARAGVPDWLREAARTGLPAYDKDTRAVVLLSEQVTTVKDAGEITTLHRRAVKILRPEGRDEARIIASSDKETKITYLKAWSISAQGVEYEVKEKDAIETQLVPGEIYQEVRRKVLNIPGAAPGAVVGYEYEQKRRPSILEDAWWFQEEIPVVRASLTLRLPGGWEFKPYWSNHSALEPQVGAGQWTWQLSDLPGVKSERMMPPWPAVCGWLAVHYYPSGSAHLATGASWQSVGSWYSQLTAGRRDSTPEIRKKVEEVTAGSTTLQEKVAKLSTFVQQDIRYAAIEIGIGGYQPHAARDIFSNHYGDCKDKATLLSAMLHEVGVESYYVLINTRRGAIRPDVPSIEFNHAVLAIRVPNGDRDNRWYALFTSPRLGQLLFFDPTSTLTPFGSIPDYLQDNYGLVVTDQGGELVQLPLMPPVLNRLLRVAKLSLSRDGTLSGTVEEVRSGEPAATRRSQLRDLPEPERKKFFEDLLAASISGPNLVDYKVESLDEFDQNLYCRYRFVARNYAQTAGELLLVRPRVLGNRSSDVLEGKQRNIPVEFGQTLLESDIFEITMPQGYAMDELPAPVARDYGFAAYKSQIKVEGNVMKYSRDYTVSELEVPVARLDDLKQFYRQIAEDESNTAVLKRVP